MEKRVGRLGGHRCSGAAGGRQGRSLVRRRLRFAPGLAGKRLGQTVQRRQAQTEGFDAPAVREFLQHLIELPSVIAQLALQRALAELQAEHGAAQGEQGRQCEQQGGEACLGQGCARGETELPVRIAAVQGKGRGVACLADLGQDLGRGVAELLGQLQLAGLRRQGRQAVQQALEVKHQQQGALGRCLVVQAQRCGAVDQPALAHPVGLGAGLLVVFQSAQQVQGGIVHRRRALAVLLRLAGQVEVRIDHAIAVAQAALSGRQLDGVAAVEGVDQAGILGRDGGVRAQLGDGLAQGGRLAFAPGLAELVDPVLFSGMDHAEPEQGASGGYAAQGGEHAGKQVARTLGAGPGFTLRAGRAVGGGILAAALEAFQ
ncbi:hypothetical protein D9M70_473360 [compost metagenome]